MKQVNRNAWRIGRTGIICLDCAGIDENVCLKITEITGKYAFA
jgi:hypothetical protein